MMRIISVSLLYAAAAFFVSSVVAQDNRDYRLVLTSHEMHSAPINQVAVDANNRFLITASDDKSIRLWELSTGRHLKTLTPPSGPGDLGKINALAVSPDAKRLAITGYTGKKT